MTDAPVLDAADEWSAPRLHAGHADAADYGRPTIVDRSARTTPPAAPPATVVVHSLDATQLKRDLPGPVPPQGPGRVVESAPQGRRGSRSAARPASGPVVVTGSQDRPAPVPTGPRFTEPVPYTPGDAAAISLPAPVEKVPAVANVPAVRRVDERPERSAGTRPADLDRWGLQAEAVFAARAAAQAAAQAQLATPVTPKRVRSPRVKRFWFTAIVVVIVAGLGFGSYELFFADDSAPVRSPAAVVSAYLDALAKGDADAALAQGAGAPPVDTFVTDDALAQQHKIAPLTAIGVTDTQIVDGQAQVSAHYQFGQRGVNTTFVLVKHDGRWLLQNTTVAIGVSALASLPDPTLFGQSISTSTVYVFPGPLAWGALDGEDFAIVDPNPGQYATSPSGAHIATVRLSATLTATGHKRIDTAVAAYLSKCAGSTRAVPLTTSHCPQQLDDQAYNGAATWSAPHKLSSETLTRGTEAGATSTVTVSGRVAFNATYHQVVGNNGARGPRHNKTMIFTVTGQVNLAPSTPVFVPET